jgi:3',5'-cyclic AMP phosphodiesterase CpdA
MRKVVHISDPHFGTVRPELVEPLIESVNGLSPDLVILSGDLTQRATDTEYENARKMMDRFIAPVLTVPGNHDTPLYNLWSRFLHPWKRYNRWVGEEMSPIFRDEKMLVIGVNTVNRFAWRSGKISERVMNKMVADLSEGADDLMKIVVVHHPLAQEPKDGRVRTKGGKATVEALCENGADLVLSGHMHMWRVKRFREREGTYSALQVQAGTCLSNRLRGEPNDFALLTFDDANCLTVERYVARENTPAFAHNLREQYVNGTLGWEQA